MANDLVTFNENRPAHITAFFDEGERNIDERISVPSLSYGGKVWTISLSGEKTKLEKTDADGDKVPLSVMRVIVLDFAKKRGRTYYEKPYDDANPAKPDCYSADGVRPDASIVEPQAYKCDGCPKSIKGSRITDNGMSVVACSQHRLVAVVPANKPDFEPLRLKLAITSLFDGRSPDLQAEGWYAFDNYTDMLRAKQTPSTTAVVTKMKFDPNVKYPKIVFARDRWTDEATLKVVREVAKGDKVKTLISGLWVLPAADGAPARLPAADGAPARLPMEDLVVNLGNPKADKADVASPARESVDRNEAAAEKFVAEEIAAERIAAKQEVAVRKTAAEKIAAQKAAPMHEDEDDDADFELPGSPTPVKAMPVKFVAPPARESVDRNVAPVKQPVEDVVVSADISSNVADLLAEWADD